MLKYKGLHVTGIESFTSPASDFSGVPLGTFSLFISISTKKVHETQHSLLNAVEGAMKSQALGKLPGQRLFNISTVKAQLDKTAAFLGLQDTGWPWTMALTVLDV